MGLFQGDAMNTVAAIESLVRRGYTLASLERALHLSPNYLSKVRHEAVRPSFQLAALLVLIAKDPQSVLAALTTVDEPTPRPQNSRASSLIKTDDQNRAADNVVERVAAALAPAAVRFAFFSPALHLDPSTKEPIDVVIHDADRHAMTSLKDAGFLCGHFSSALFRCRLADAPDDTEFSLHFPTTIPPLSQVFETPIEPQLINGVMVPVVDATTTALWLLLNRRPDAQQVVQHLVDRASVDVDTLDVRLSEFDALPQTQSTYVLQVFDRALARERLRHIKERM